MLLVCSVFSAFISLIIIFAAAVVVFRCCVVSIACTVSLCLTFVCTCSAVTNLSAGTGVPAATAATTVFIRTNSPINSTFSLPIPPQTPATAATTAPLSGAATAKLSSTSVFSSPSATTTGLFASTASTPRFPFASPTPSQQLQTKFGSAATNTVGYSPGAAAAAAISLNSDEDIEALNRQLEMWQQQLQAVCCSFLLSLFTLHCYLMLSALRLRCHFGCIVFFICS